MYFFQGGTTDVLQYDDIAPPADCSDNQVLVRIKAIGINS